MLYEIIEDCRIANKNFVKWDIVSVEEVWGYYTSIMKPLNWKATPKVEEKPTKVVEEKKEEEVKEEKPKTKRWKKK